MKKILFVGINSKFIHTNLALRYIIKYAEKNIKDEKYSMKLVEYTINNTIYSIIKNIYKEKAEIILFSMYIWNREYTLKVIKEVKKVLPNSKIILGGPEAAYDAVDIMNENQEIDFIIFGEGEKVVLNFLKEDNAKSIKGIYYRENGVILSNKPEKLIENLDDVPFPYTEEEIKELIAERKIIYYESSRGCPFNCSYCMSSIEKSVRFFSLDRVKKDLKFFIENSVNLVKFVDRTYNLKKDRYLEIWRYIVDNYKEGIRFHFEITLDLFDEEVLEFLETVPKGLFQFEIGIQTINKKTLKAINRKNDLERISKNISLLKKNIHLHLDLIAGLPYEDYKTFGNSFNYVYGLNPEMLQLGFLKILKGTQISTEIEKYGYKYLNFQPYEVLENKFICYGEIVKLKNIEKLVDFYFNSNEFNVSVPFIINNFYDSSFEFYEDFSEWWDNKKYFEVAHKKIAVFDFLYDFYLEKEFDKLDMFKDYLKFDYIKMEKPRFFHEWYKKNVTKNEYENIISNSKLNIEFKSVREKYKKTEVEIFNYDILNGEKDNYSNNKNGSENIKILFIYKNNETEIRCV
ncbi:B12-binding domain-containing radical SAM protein [Haliovirga abyssi]|uniref:B12-binding domain-containing radical SAM protein n=1 Tax=Haliovirga abyssi TaxID=2996794 RepID=A0AAU9DGZ6_9FUSO|nr:B12-binding domain-containing radical SAM protein [Haliovirga abyssi]BDU49979.1 B12-binding domain-containing radical SAM protein [Haliovirga abyssi]